MKCEKCHELLSDFLDGTLTNEDQSLLSAHLQECLACDDVRQDFDSILTVARESHEVYVSPPNERALWLRILNSVESGELMPARVSATGSRFSYGESWSRWMTKSWELTLPQLTSALAAIVITVSLITAFGLQKISSGAPGNNNTGGSAPEIGAQAPGMNRVNFVRQQQSTMDYWKQRVEQRKARWNPRMRDAFDRNMNVIDQVVNDSLTELNSNPHDEISEETLKAALSNKLELLKEFSDL